MATSPNAVSGLPAGYTLEQPTAQATPPANTGNVSGLPAGYTLETDTQPTTAPAATKETPIRQLFGGMHGGSYDIAFRDPQGQISPDTIKAEAVGGTVGDALDGVAMVAPTVIPNVVDKAKAVYQWASANPIKSFAIEQMANELGVHPFDLMHAAVKYGKNLFGDSETTK